MILIVVLVRIFVFLSVNIKLCFIAFGITGRIYILILPFRTACYLLTEQQFVIWSITEYVFEYLSPLWTIGPKYHSQHSPSVKKPANSSLWLCPSLKFHTCLCNCSPAVFHLKKNQGRASRGGILFSSTPLHIRRVHLTWQGTEKNK